MFTSRAEHRLLLRVDNADLRLTARGREVGLVDEVRWESFAARRARHQANLAKLSAMTLRETDGSSVSAQQWLRRPGRTLRTMGASQFALAEPVSRVDEPSVETAVKFEGYLKRQEADIARSARSERRAIPRGFQYAAIPGLSSEVVQRLTQVQPETLGQAMRVPGITPAAVAVLATYVSRSALS